MRTKSVVRVYGCVRARSVHEVVDEMISVWCWSFLPILVRKSNTYGWGWAQIVGSEADTTVPLTGRKIGLIGELADRCMLTESLPNVLTTTFCFANAAAVLFSR